MHGFTKARVYDLVLSFSMMLSVRGFEVLRHIWIRRTGALAATVHFRHETAGRGKAIIALPPIRSRVFPCGFPPTVAPSPTWGELRGAQFRPAMTSWS